MKTVLVTGASGFIGQHALAPLVRRGFTVHAATGPRQPAIASCPAVAWHVVDLLDTAETHELLQTIRPEYLLHFAWYVEPGKFWGSTENLHWVEGSLALLRAFAAAGGKRVVLAGTCAEYDWTLDEPCSEYHTRLQPATLYGVCKHALHQMLAGFAANQGMSYAWGRIFSPYGPGEHPSKLVASVISSLLRDKPALCSPGNQLRDYMYTKDIADAFVALLDSQITGPVNVASGESVTIKEVVHLIGAQLGRQDLIQLGVLEAPKGDPSVLVANVDRLRNEVAWLPNYDLTTGIAETIAWWRNHL
jgi:nucleoside-diphosphate-sugar epimerase